MSKTKFYNKSKESESDRRYEDEVDPKEKRDAPKQQYSKGNNNFRGGYKGRGGFTKSGGSRKTLDQFKKDAQPKDLSTKSNDNNDLLMSKGFVVDGLSSMMPMRRVPNFKLDYSAYLVLVEKSYLSITKSDKTFLDNVSPAMYDYYCVIMLWRRILEVLYQRGEYMNECEQLTMRTKHFSVQIPKDIEIYLAGIGEVTDFSALKAELLLNGELTADEITTNVKGTYGRVDANTHILYETLPAPGILIYRMMQDMQAYIDGVGADWDLPENLLPSNNVPNVNENAQHLNVANNHGENPGNEAQHEQDNLENQNIEEQNDNENQAANAVLAANYEVNQNLLGWKRSYVLTRNQVSTLDRCGILATEVNVPVNHILNIPFIDTLIHSVSEQLKRSRIELSKPEESAQTSGSLAQVLFTVPVPIDVTFNRRAIASGRTGITHSSCQTNINVLSGAVAFRYRFKRKLTDDDIHSLCYTIVSGQNRTPPPGWQATANNILETAPPTWNEPRFLSAASIGVDVLASVSSKYYIPKRLESIGK